jgi:hypothetical protein
MGYELCDACWRETHDNCEGDDCACTACFYGPPDVAELQADVLEVGAL